MNKTDIVNEIINGNTVLGVEFGTTRIKAALINKRFEQIASGSHKWENRYENGLWTYSLGDIWTGLQDSIHNLNQDINEKFGTQLGTVKAIGFSAMMHGYMPFDQHGNLLVPFRTWRNVMTGEASSQLTELFGFNIPQRWSIAHLYQAILNKESHIQDISFITTLAGYVHWKLSGKKVLGIGEASGVLPIDNTTKNYDLCMIERFNAKLLEKNISWRIQDVLPEIIQVGENAGSLTEEGARILDPTGRIHPGTPLCPPEGDAITGMIATNSILERSGSISAGTSVFVMAVLEKPLSKPYPEIDVLTATNGKQIAMIHSNNCTSDLNAWVQIFLEFSNLLDVDIDQTILYDLLFKQALLGDSDGGGLLVFNNISGEHLLNLEEGFPIVIRTSGSSFTLANFMRSHLFSALAALKIGMSILFDQEKVAIDHMYGQGGFFKTKQVGQKVMAAALNTPITVLGTAGEGGAWGMALLASYMCFKKADEPFDSYISNRVFSGQKTFTIAPDPFDVMGFEKYMERYHQGLDIERKAVKVLGKSTSHQELKTMSGL